MMSRNLLLLALIALGATCVVLMVQLAARSSEIEMLHKSLATAELINSHNVDQVNKLAKEKADLVTKLAEGVARSEAAVERIAVLELENETLERAFLEQQKALEDDPDVAQWMSAGMPVAAACSLWPAARDCQN
jgi:HAMP domain-containing protein